MNKIAVGVMSIVTLFSLKANADSLFVGYKNKHFRQSYKVHSAGSDLLKVTNRSYLDIINLAYDKNFKRFNIETGVHFDITNNTGAKKVASLDDGMTFYFPNGNSDYRDIYVKAKKAINNKLNIAVKARYSEFDVDTINGTSFEREKNHVYAVEAIAEYSKTINNFTYSLEIGPVLEKGFSKFSSHGAFNGIMGFDYINAGYVFNPSVSYSFSDNLKLKLAYNRTQTKDISISGEKYTFDSADTRMADHTKLDENIGLNLSYKF
ncbi:MAG: hypothetical protein GY793_04535 [Proteobacteria bacterium]|nr:hypothetical protein [Pseudomonadota bacterium]